MKNPILLKVVFIVCISIVFFIGAITFKHMSNLESSADVVFHSYSASNEIKKLLIELKYLELAKRDYIITNDESIKTSIEGHKYNISSYLKNIEALVKDNSEQVQNLNILKKYITHKYKIVDEIILKDFSNPKFSDDFMKNMLSGRRIMDEIQATIGNMIAIEDSLLTIRKKELEESRQTTPFFIYGILLLSLALLSLAFYRMNEDLTELRQINSNLEISDNANRFGQEVGKFGNWHYDLSENKWYFSDNLYKILGAEPKSFEPNIERFYGFIHPEDLDKVKERSVYLTTKQELPPAIYRVIREDGAIIYVKTTGRLVTAKDGMQFMAGCTTDVTEDVMKENEILERNRVLVANNKELEAFNYVASHDMQEPLRKIETFISRLIEKDIDQISDVGKQYIERIQASAGRMRILINDLLQFSRSTRAEKSFEKTDLNVLLENAKYELNQVIEEKKANISTSALPTLQVIPFQIQQLFTNLLSNSLKYSKADIPTQIEVKAEKVTAKDDSLLSGKQGTFARISFKDNGIGFDQEYSDKIFTLFSRLHNREDYSGTGIGLAICKKIVENHNGQILAEGKSGEGAKFIVYLPA